MKIKNWRNFVVVVISKFTVFAPQNFVLRLNTSASMLMAKQSVCFSTSVKPGIICFLFWS